MSDAIRPDHYKAGAGDVIDFCKRYDLNFNLGNVVKYVARAGKKGPALQDLRKALEYLNREIEHEQERTARTSPCAMHGNEAD